MYWKYNTYHIFLCYNMFLKTNIYIYIIFNNNDINMLCYEYYFLIIISICYSIIYLDYNNLLEI